MSVHRLGRGTVILYQVLATDILIAEYATMKAMGYSDASIKFTVSTGVLYAGQLSGGAGRSVGLYWLMSVKSTCLSR